MTTYEKGDVVLYTTSPLSDDWDKGEYLEGVEDAHEIMYHQIKTNEGIFYYPDNHVKKMTNQQKVEEAFPINSCEGCPFAVKHSSTHHIGCSKLVTSEAARILMTLAPQKIIPVIEGDEVSLPLIEINAHGKRNGWAEYPWMFDPVWIKCRLPLK